MTRGTRLLLAVLIGGCLLTAATIAAGAAAVYRAGSITVEVFEDEGGRFDVSVPAGLARVAIALAPDAILEEAAGELEPVLPALHAGWEEFVRSPDFVIVEVHSDDEHVRVEKQGRKLSVLVDSPEAKIRISIPLHTVSSLIGRLDV